MLNWETCQSNRKNHENEKAGVKSFDLTPVFVS